MASSTRVQALTEVSDLISVIKEYLSNPKMADQLKEEVVRLNSLTEDEQNKHIEAKALMQKKNKLESEISMLEQRLEKEMADHAQNIKETAAKFSEKMAQDKKSIDEEHANMDKRKFSLDDFELRLNQRENKLKEQAALIKGIIKD